MKCRYRILLSFGLLLFLTSCGFDLGFLKKSQDNAVAQVDDQVLYYDDVVRNLDLSGLSEGDSLLLVDSYVKNWVSDQMMYNNAKNSVENMALIDSLVEVYRRSLIVYEYELSLVKDHLADKLSEQQMRVFYKENSSLFLLSEPLVKGMTLVAYSDVPDIQVLEGLMEIPSDGNIDLISSISIKNAAKFEYFANRWLPLSEVQKNCPVPFKEKELQAKHLTTVQDSTYKVFFYVEDVKQIGDLQPFEYAQERIKSILTEQNKNEYLRNYRKTLYETGIQKGQAKRYK